MPDKPVFLYFDVFAPAEYPLGDQTDGDDDHVFVVATPALVDGKTLPIHHPEGGPDYLKLTPDAFAAIVKPIQESDAGVAGDDGRHEIALVQVPFVAGTTIKLRVEVEGAEPWEDDRTVGGASGSPEYAFESPTEVATWLIRINGSKHIDRYDHIVDPIDLPDSKAKAPRRLAELFSWAMALATELRAFVAANPDSSGPRSALFERYFAAGVFDPPNPWLEERWWEHLVGGLVDYPGDDAFLQWAGQDWAVGKQLPNLYWLAIDARFTGASVEGLSPPTFKYTPEKLLEHADELFPDPGSYTDVFLAALKWAARHGEAGKTDAKATASRLYGFGERVRWRKGAIGDENPKFMVLESRDDRGEDAPGYGLVDADDQWVHTNAQSLAGHVFRVGPLPKTAVNPDQISVRVWVGGRELDQEQLSDVRTQIWEVLKIRSGWPDESPFDSRLEEIRTPAVHAVPIAGTPELSTHEIPIHQGGNKRVVHGALPSVVLDALSRDARDAAPRGAETGRLGTTVLPLRFATVPDFANTTNAGENLLPWSTVTRRVSVRIRLTRVPVARSEEDEGEVLQLRIATELRRSDLDRLYADLRRVWNDQTVIELWVPPTDDAGAVVYNVDMSRRKRVGDNKFFVLDPEAELWKLLEPHTSNDESALPGALLDLFYDLPALADDGSDNRIFNTIERARADGEEELNEPLDAFWFVSHQAYRFEFLRSVDMLGLSFMNVLTCDAPRDNSLAEHFTNFNKFRVHLLTADGLKVEVNKTDALAPREERVEPGGTRILEADYKILHRFSEELVADGGLIEGGRYRMFERAGQPMTLAGHCEHQYAYRFDVNVEDPFTFELGVSTPIRNLASEQRDVPAFRVKIGASDGDPYGLMVGGTLVQVSETEPKEVASQFQSQLEALGTVVVERPDEERPALVILPLAGRAVTRASGALEVFPDSAEPRWALTYAHADGKDGGEDSFSFRLDPLYFESLIPAGDDWGDEAEHRRVLPALRGLYEALIDMRRGQLDGDQTGGALLAERWNFDNRQTTVSADEAAKPGVRKRLPALEDHLRFVEDRRVELTPARFAGWLTVLEPTFAEFRESLKEAVRDYRSSVASGQAPDHPFWEPVVIPAREFDPAWAHLHKTTNVVRIGMGVKRRTQTTFRSEPPESGDTGPFAGTVSQNDIDLRPLRLPRPGKTEPVELTLNIPPGSPWAAIKEVLHPEHDLREDLDWIVCPTGNAKRLRELLGEAAPYVCVPSGPRDPEDKAVLLYPTWGFIPLAPVRPLGKVKFENRQSVHEFSKFLTQIIDQVAHPEHVHAGPLDDITWTFAGAEEALDVRDAARTFIRDELAGELQKLVAPAHRPDGDSDPNPAIDERVSTMLSALHGSILNAFKSLFTAQPSRFAFAKGIATPLFDPPTFPERLYSMRVHKAIRTQEEGKAEELPVAERETFSFLEILGQQQSDSLWLRYCVDVLEDSVYDNDFEIPGCQGRTGEDLLENTNPYDGDRSAPQVVIDVEHYNKSWETEDKDKALYLLPSRRYPAVPVPIRPERKGPAQGDNPFIRHLLPDGWQTNNPAIDSAALVKALGEILPNVLELPVKDEGDEGAKVVAERDGDLAFIVDPVNDDLSEAAAGWWRADTYLSIYYYFVEPDEENDTDQDTYRIEVELADRPDFGAESLEAGPGDAGPEAEPVDPEDAERLYEWFLYLQAKAREEKDLVEPKPPLDLPTILRGVQAWTAHGLFTPQEKQPETGMPGEYDVQLAKVGGVWSLEDHWDKDDGVGRVIAADVLLVKPSSGDEGDDDENASRAAPRRIVRVAVLDEPYRFTRSRMQILRNRRFVGADLQPDFNPIFEMPSKLTEWVTYGLQPLRYLTTALPFDIATLEVNDYPFSDWIKREAGTANLGDILGAALVHPIGDTTKHYFSEKARSQYRPLAAYLSSVLPSVAPTILNKARSTGDSSGELSPAERQVNREQIAKASLGVVRSSHTATLTSAVPKAVRSATPFLTAQWYLEDPELSDTPSRPKGRPIMEITFMVEWAEHDA